LSFTACCKQKLRIAVSDNLGIEPDRVLIVERGGNRSPASDLSLLIGLRRTLSKTPQISGWN